jgi:hypothetical protein
MRARFHGRERGITAVGLIILITFLGLFVYAGIRLLPLYLEYMNVVRSMQTAKSDAESGAQAIRIALEKRFDIEDIKSLSYKDIEISKEGSTWVVHAAYDAQTDFIGNVGFVVHFDKTVNLSGTPSP